MAMPRSAAATLFIGLPPISSSPAGDPSSPAIIAQQRGLAAAGGADEDDEFAVGDGERDIAHRLDLAEALADIPEVYRRHAPNPSP